MSASAMVRSSARRLRHDAFADAELVEGNAVSGELAELTKRWGLRKRAGDRGRGRDNAAGARRAGAVHAGDAFVSLGTSGVLWATTAAFAPAPARAVHAFCHAFRTRGHQMGSPLSAAASLAWWAEVTGRTESFCWASSIRIAWRRAAGSRRT
jgi:xylulokinase